MAGELTTVFDEQVPLLPQDKEGKPELGVTWVISEGCNILQLVKVNVEFVQDRHLPGFEVATVTGPPAEVMGGRNISVTGWDIDVFCST